MLDIFYVESCCYPFLTENVIRLLFIAINYRENIFLEAINLVICSILTYLNYLPVVKLGEKKKVLLGFLVKVHKRFLNFELLHKKIL